MLAATAEMFGAVEAGVDRHRDHVASSEAELVNAARRGDRAAFGRLHDRYASMVHAIALARVPVPDAHDLVQDVFVEAMGKLHALRDALAFGPWLAAIARNLANDHLRRKRRNKLMTNSAVRVSSELPASQRDSDEASRILDVIRTLPDAYAETLVLRLVEQLTGPQIAACTGMTPGSVRVNLHRGMQMLKRALPPEWRIDQP